MEKILIIKTGAAGDVVRTSGLLNVLQGNIYWVSSARSKLLLPDDIPNLTMLTVNEAFQSLKDISFSQTVSLEEDYDCARLAGEVNAKDITGVYLDNDKINYTENSSYWFDMSRVSKLGLKKANELKAANSLSCQECIFNMFGKKDCGHLLAE